MKIIPPQKLWQWDINKKVYISGITDADEWQVHFAADDDRTALVLQIKHDDSGYWAYIPNQLVCEGRLLLCYLYNQVEDWAHTETMIKIPVQRRPKPAGYTLVLTDIETRGSLREDIGSLSSLTTQTQNNLVDAINEVNAKQHNDLDGRDAADVHPMSSITGLEKKLQSIDSAGTGQAKAIAQLKQDIKTNEATDKSQSQAISSMQQSISSIQSASESNAAAISDMQVSISSINDVDYNQSQAIADVQSNIMSLIDKDTVLSQDIAALENADSTLSQSISSLASSVDSAFAEVETALDGKQPVGNYVTSVNGSAPDEGGNVSIDVQTYTAGDGIDISDSGEIAVTNPMDDEQVSSGTTWSSAKIISSVSQSFQQSGSIITCQPVEGSELHVVSEITAVQEGEGDPSPDNVRPIVGWNGANLIRCGTNLWPDFIVSQTYANGNTVTVNDDGWIDVHKVEGLSISQHKSGVFLPLSTYTLSNGIDTGSSVYFQVNDDNGNNLYTIPYPTSTQEILSRDGMIHLYSNRLSIADVSLRPSLNVGSSVLPYEPYRGQTYTADFGETVYGGTLDWATGVLTVTWQQFQITDSTRLLEVESWSRPEENTIAVAIMGIGHKAGDNNIAFNKLKYSNVASNFAPWIYLGNISSGEVYVRVPGTTLEEARQNIVSQSIVGITEISTPYTIQLTPAQVVAISGTNTVYCDTGNVTVTGYEDPRHTVAQLTSRIAALESAATGI